MASNLDHLTLNSPKGIASKRSRSPQIREKKTYTLIRKGFKNACVARLWIFWWQREHQIMVNPPDPHHFVLWEAAATMPTVYIKRERCLFSSCHLRGVCVKNIVALWAIMLSGMFHREQSWKFECILSENARLHPEWDTALFLILLSPLEVLLVIWKAVL